MQIEKKSKCHQTILIQTYSVMKRATPPICIHMLASCTLRVTLTLLGEDWAGRSSQCKL